MHAPFSSFVLLLCVIVVLTNVSTVQPTTSDPTISPSTAATSANPSTAVPSAEPSTAVPSANPSTAVPSAEPSTAAPSTNPSAEPSTASPSTAAPSANPSTAVPSAEPSTAAPSAAPSANPSTAAPSAEPSTIAPTASPSTVPVGTDGYVYIQSYTASDCGGSKSGVSGFLANYCYNASSYYRKYMFTKDDCSDLVELKYNDSSCSSFTSSTAMTSFTSCTNYEDEDSSLPAYYSSFQYFCSAGSNNIPVPMDSYIEGVYDSDDCSVPYEYFLTATDVCLNSSTSGYASGLHFSCGGTGTYDAYNITLDVYDSDVCATSALNGTSEEKRMVCYESQQLEHSRRLHSGHDDDGEHTARYSSYCLMANRAPSSTPSSRPSYGIGSPTPAPTKFKGVKFSASQTLNGITLSEYQESQSAYEEILGEAIANSMKSDLITSSNINSLQAAAGSRRLDGSSDIYVLIRRRLATTSSIALTYTVLTQESSLTYEGLSSQLKSSVSSGYFNKQLQSIASGEGYNALAQCTSSSATTVNETPTSSSSSNKDDSLSGGAIAGIVIGSVFGAVLLGLGLYYFLGPKGQ